MRTTTWMWLSAALSLGACDGGGDKAPARDGGADSDSGRPGDDPFPGKPDKYPDCDEQDVRDFRPNIGFDSLEPAWTEAETQACYDGPCPDGAIGCFLDECPRGAELEGCLIDEIVYCGVNRPGADCVYEYDQYGCCDLTNCDDDLQKSDEAYFACIANECDTLSIALQECAATPTCIDFAISRCLPPVLEPLFDSGVPPEDAGTDAATAEPDAGELTDGGTKAALQRIVRPRAAPLRSAMSVLRSRAEPRASTRRQAFSERFRSSGRLPAVRRTLHR